MIDLDDYFLNITATPEMADKLVSGTAPTLYDLCQKLSVTDEVVEEYAAGVCETNERYCLPDIPEKCRVSARPIDFVYDRKTDSYDLSDYDSDMELIGKVQTGKGSEFIHYGYKHITVGLLFAGTIPRQITQDFETGRNDLYGAKATRFAY